MEVMIPVRLELPDTPLGLGALETLVHAWGQAVTRQALAEAWAAQAPLRGDGGCPGCGGPASTRAGHKPRRVETLFGPVTLARQRRRCAGCGRCFQPDDVGLAAALGAGRLTPAARDLAAWCGASWPYRQAAAFLAGVRGAPLAVETVRAAVAAVGARVAQEQAAAARQACAPPATAPEPEPLGPDRLVLELDGGWVRCHDNPRGLEIKVGVVHAGGVAVGRTRRKLDRRVCAATAHGAADLGPLVTEAIARVNGFAAREHLLLGDGAGWIWRLGGEVLPTATRVLDRWHLSEARRRALRRAVPDKAARAPWNARVDACLDTGDVPGALAVLADLATDHPHDALAGFAGYLTALAPCIPDYAARRAAGERIGSGGIEKSVDLVVNRRCKGRRGMRWWRERLHPLIALRIAILNETWNAASHSPPATGF